MRLVRCCRAVAEAATAHKAKTEGWALSLEKAARSFQTPRGSTHPSSERAQDICFDAAWVQQHLIQPVLAARTRAQAGMFEEGVSAASALKAASASSTSAKTRSSTSKGSAAYKTKKVDNVPGAAINAQAKTLQTDLREIMLTRPDYFSERFHVLYLHILAPQTKFLALKPKVLHELLHTAESKEEVQMLPSLLQRFWQGTSHPVYANMSAAFFQKLLRYDFDETAMHMLCHSHFYGLKLTLPLVNHMLALLLRRAYRTASDGQEETSTEDAKCQLSHQMYALLGTLKSHGLKADHKTHASLLLSLYLRADKEKTMEMMASETPLLLGLLKTPTPFTFEAMATILFAKGENDAICKLYEKVVRKRGVLTPRGALLAGLAAKRQGLPRQDIFKMVSRGFWLDKLASQTQPSETPTCPEELGASFAKRFNDEALAIKNVPSLKDAANEILSLLPEELAPLDVTIKTSLEPLSIAT